MSSFWAAFTLSPPMVLMTFLRYSFSLARRNALSDLPFSSATTAYSGSKAFDSIYLEGLQFKADRLGVDVCVTDVKPGFVDTPMTEGRSDMFWIAPADKAARQIYDAIRKRRRHVYVTKRWRLMGWLMKILPHRAASWVQSRRQG